MEEAFGAEVGPIEDVAEPIVGYRMFHVREPRLRSVSRDVLWPTAAEGGLVARCFPKTSSTPKGNEPPCPYPEEEIHGEAYGFGCGIYAAKSIEELLAKEWGGRVLGRVLLGGRVREHTHGYRAQFAVIDAIYDQTFKSFYHPMMAWSGISAKMELDLVSLAREYGVELLDMPPRKIILPKMGGVA